MSMRISVVSILCLLPAALSVAEETVTRQLGDDVFVSGGRPQVTQGSRGDAIVAGGELVVSGRVGGDAVAAGGKIMLSGSIGDDVYAAGGEINLNGQVAGNARMAGGRIHIGTAANIAGGVSVAGGDIWIDGRIGRYLQAAGGKIHIEGRIGGDVEVAGDELIIGPNAEIEGALRFRGPHPPDVASGARIRGGVHHTPDSGALLSGWVGVAAWLLGWILVGAAVIAVWPRFTGAVSETSQRRLPLSVGIGALVMIGAPFLIALLVMSFVGIPFALLLFAVYLLLFPLGYLAGAASLGEWAWVRMGQGRALATRERILALGVALIALFLVMMVPVLGRFVALAVLLAGIGSLIVTATVRSRAA